MQNVWGKLCCVEACWNLGIWMLCYKSQSHFGVGDGVGCWRTTCPYHNAVCFQDMDGSSKDHRKLKININNIKTNDYPGNILSYYHFNVCVRKSVHHPDAEILCMFLTMEHPPLYRKSCHVAPVILARAGAIDEGFHCRQHECPLSSPVSQVTITTCQ